MLKYWKTMVCASAVCAGAAHLSGCGQSGPLYLPKDKPAANLPAPPHAGNEASPMVALDTA
jgi:predicted small lipoprotein YifL